VKKFWKIFFKVTSFIMEDSLALIKALEEDVSSSRHELTSRTEENKVKAREREVLNARIKEVIGQVISFYY
jgi:hypothetical protein